MQSDTTRGLANFGPHLSLFHTIPPSRMSFLQPNTTHSALIHTLHTLIFVPETPGHRTWLLISQFECLLALAVSLFIIVKKRSLGNHWLISRKNSPYGSFYLTNATLCLILGAAGYLIGWCLTSIVVAAFSFAGMSSNAWWWIIPLAWSPLVVGAYVSIHGFVMSCSPRSPMSPFSAKQKDRWWYLPVPRGRWVDATLVAPVLVFLAVTASLVICAGRAYFRATKLAVDVLPEETWRAVSMNSFDGGQWGDATATDELVENARRVAAAYLDIHRYVCLNLCVSAIAAFFIHVPCCIYGLPNISSLVDHAVSRTQCPLPPSSSFVLKTLWLLTKGKPTETSPPGNQLGLITWKMTMIAIGYVCLLVVCVPAFGCIPIFIVVSSFPGQVETGDFSPTLRSAIIFVSVITSVTGAGLTWFCTVMTLDPLFRSVLGMNVIRNQIPINVVECQPKELTSESDVEKGMVEGDAKGLSVKASSSTLANSFLVKQEVKVSKEAASTFDELESNLSSPSTLSSPTERF